MDREHEVKAKLLKENYDVILSEIDGGLITLDQIKELGLRLDKTKKVNGTFVAQTQQGKDVKPKDVWRKMLDTWWGVELHKPEVDGLKELVIALNESDLSSLAHQMRPKPSTSPESVTDDTSLTEVAVLPKSSSASSVGTNRLASSSDSMENSPLMEDNLTAPQDQDSKSRPSYRTLKWSFLGVCLFLVLSLSGNITIFIQSVSSSSLNVGSYISFSESPLFLRWTNLKIVSSSKDPLCLVKQELQSG